MTTRCLPRPIAAALASALVATALAAPSASAVTATDLRLGSLPRGADVAVPHLEDHTVVDGDVRVPVDADLVDLLGEADGGYLVVTGDEQGRHGRVYRIGADGSRTKLARSAPYQTTLSDDGGTLVGYRVTGGYHDDQRTVVQAWSAQTGEKVATRRFAGFVTVLDARRGRVLLGSFEPARTLLWRPSGDHVRVVNHQPGYAADLSSGLLARFTGDPFRHGCTVVSRLRTGERLWRSCSERVDSFSTDGSEMATIDKLSDGIGPSRVTTRLVTGRAVGRFDTPHGYFGRTRFESPTAVLLPTTSGSRQATVRCEDQTCERASDLTAATSPRRAASAVRRSVLPAARP